jgi:ABC-2 type transport system permease protein
MNAQRSLTRLYWLELKSEFLKMFRLPAYVVPTLAFPLLFYVFFGLAFGHRNAGSISMSAYLIATYGTFGVVGASLFGFGVGVAVERGQGWLQVKRASPMPLSAWFAAKIGMATLFCAVIITGLFTLGATFGGVRFDPAVWAQLFVSLVCGALPFCALGLAIGYLAGPNSAPAIVNVIYLPLSFASGLWVPVEFLPKFMKQIAPFLPPYHLAQLALKIIGATPGRVSTNIVALASFSVLFIAIAAFAYRRDEGKIYG